MNGRTDVVRRNRRTAARDQQNVHVCEAAPPRRAVIDHFAASPSAASATAARRFIRSLERSGRGRSAAYSIMASCCRG